MSKIIIRLRNNFITGFAVTLPLLLTIFIIWILYKKISIYLLNPVIEVIEPYLPLYWMIYFAKALALVIILLIVCLIGLAAKNIIMMKFFGGFENFLTRVPLIGRIYKAIRQISNAFLGEGKTIFNKVIMIEYPRKGIYSIGFITRRAEGEVQKKTTGKEVFSVFVPTTPNPTSGIFLLVPEDEIIMLDMSVEEALKLVISGGGIIPKYEIDKKDI